MKTIEKVEIVFENCELVIIEGKYIDNIAYTDERLYTIKFNRELNNIKQEELSIVGSNGNIRNPMERLIKYADITQCEVFYSDNTKVDVKIIWGEDDQNNECQINSIQPNGDLIITFVELECQLCKISDNTDTDNDWISEDVGDFYLNIQTETNEWDSYNDGFVWTTGYKKIKYCPNCGRKL